MKGGCNLKAAMERNNSRKKMKSAQGTVQNGRCGDTTPE